MVNKVKTLHTKIVKTEEESEKLRETKDREAWIKRMANGSESSRPRTNIKVSVYGDVKIDQDEGNAASLSLLR